MKTDTFYAITNDVVDEIKRQDAKWGEDRGNPGTLWMTILMEEVGEVAEAILEKDEAHAKEELTQVIAVCYQMINDIKTKNE